MQGIRRRDLIAGGAAGAAGVGILIPSDAWAANGEQRIRRIFDRIERRKARIQTRMAPARELVPGPNGAERDEAFYDDVRDVLFASLTYAELGELSPEEQVHPAVQARLWGAADDMGRGMSSIGRRMERIDDARWAELDAVARDNDSGLDAVSDAVIGEVHQLGLPPRSTQRLSATLRQLMFNVRQRGLRNPIEGMLGDLRRLEGSVSRQSDPMEAARVATPDEAHRHSEALHTASARWSTTATLTEGKLSAGGGKRLSNGASRALGALLLGIGVVGVVALIVGVGATSGYLVACLCISIPLALGTLLCLTAGILLLAGK